MNDTTATTEELRRALAAEEGGRRWLRRIAVSGGIVVIVGAGVLWRVKHRPPPPAKYVTKTVEVGDVIEKVQATGAVQPLLQVNVGAQVNGRVTEVFVDFNSPVKKGDVLAIIDPSIYGTQVSAQEAQLLGQRASLEQAKAVVESSRATMNLDKVALDRTRSLYAASLAAKADVDSAEGAYEAATATFEANIAAAGAQQAGIASQQAQLRQMTTNLGYTKIYSPVDGVVVTRSIDPGATVVSSYQAPVLFVIAQDLKKMRVMADIDEADVGKLKEGMAADAVVDAFPGEQFHGIVQQVRFSPTTTSGVVTYSAVVQVDNPEEKLRPGMTATVTIKTNEVKGAHKLPNAALRFKPTPPDGPDGKPITLPPDAPLGKGQGRVYVLTSDKPGDEKTEAKVVAIGSTDGINTALLDDSVPVGTKIVTDENDDKKKKDGS